MNGGDPRPGRLRSRRAVKADAFSPGAHLTRCRLVFCVGKGLLARERKALTQDRRSKILLFGRTIAHRFGQFVREQAFTVSVPAKRAVALEATTERLLLVSVETVEDAVEAGFEVVPAGFPDLRRSQVATIAGTSASLVFKDLQSASTLLSGVRSGLGMRSSGSMPPRSTIKMIRRVCSHMFIVPDGASSPAKPRFVASRSRLVRRLRNPKSFIRSTTKSRQSSSTLRLAARWSSLEATSTE